MPLATLASIRKTRGIGNLLTSFRRYSSIFILSVLELSLLSVMTYMFYHFLTFNDVLSSYSFEQCKPPPN